MNCSTRWWPHWSLPNWRKWNTAICLTFREQFRFTCTEFSEMLFPNNLPLMHLHNAQAYRLVGLSFGEVIELFVFVSGLCPPQPISVPGVGHQEVSVKASCGLEVRVECKHWSNGCWDIARDQSQGFIQTGQRSMYKRGGSLYCRLLRESTSLRG